MYAISQLTDAAFQQNTIQLPDGSTGTLNLYYASSAPRWFFDFVHPDFPAGAVQGLGLTTHPNLLMQYQNLLSFGLACVTTDGEDPVGSEDFVDGYATLYLLDAVDVLTVAAQVFNNVTAQGILAAGGTSF